MRSVKNEGVSMWISRGAALFFAAALAVSTVAVPAAEGTEVQEAAVQTADAAGNQDAVQDVPAVEETQAADAAGNQEAAAENAQAAEAANASEASGSQTEPAQADDGIVYAMDNKANTHEVADPSVVQTNSVEVWPQAKDIDSDYACLMDNATGVVLYGKNKDTSSPPASITKIMTCLIALENGNLDDQVTMTETGVALATDGSSNLYTQVGEVFTLRDMLYGMMLKSANDLATQVAEYIGGGSVETFVGMMNQKASDLGCRGTHFVNPSGMPADGHVSTAYDMCLITQEALKNDTFREIFSTYQYTIPATNLTEARSFTNHHHWLESPSDGVKGFVGGKTGYTDAALNTLVTVVDRDGMTLIAVTMHGNGSDVCLEDTGYLIRYGYKYFEEQTLDDSEDLARKGIVTVPTGTDASAIDSAVTERNMYPYGDVIFTQYTLQGKKVGSSVLTKEASAERERKALEESRAEALADAAASSAAEQAASASDLSAAESVGGVIDTAVTAAPTRQAEQVILPLGIQMDRTLFIVIAVLSGLILLGIISIIITVIIRND